MPPKDFNAGFPPHSDTGLETRVAHIEGQISQLVTAIEQSAKISEQNARTAEHWRENISAEIQNLGNRLTDKTAPNFGTMAAWAAVIVAVIFGISTPILSNMSETSKRDREDMHRMFSDLDIKLQREFSLSLETAKQGIANLNDLSKERHEQAVKLADRNLDRIHRLEDVRDAQADADMKELRERRMWK